MISGNDIWSVNIDGELSNKEQFIWWDSIKQRGVAKREIMEINQQLGIFKIGSRSSDEDNESIVSIYL